MRPRSVPSATEGAPGWLGSERQALSGHGYWSFAHSSETRREDRYRARCGATGSNPLSSTERDDTPVAERGRMWAFLAVFMLQRPNEPCGLATDQKIGGSSRSGRATETLAQRVLPSARSTTVAEPPRGDWVVSWFELRSDARFTMLCRRPTLRIEAPHPPGGRVMRGDSGRHLRMRRCEWALGAPG